MIELFSVTPFSGGSLLLMQIQRNYLARTVNYLLVFMLEYPKAKACGTETSVSPFGDYRFLYADTATATTASATSTTIEFPQTINGRIGAAKFVIGPNPFEMKG